VIRELDLLPKGGNPSQQAALAATVQSYLALPLDKWDENMIAKMLQDVSKLTLDGNTGGGQRAGMQKTHSANQAQTKPKPGPDQQNRAARQGIKCYNCNLRGHFARDCPTAQKTKSADKAAELASAAQHSRAMAAQQELSAPQGQRRIASIFGLDPNVCVEIPIPALADTGASKVIVPMSLLRNAVPSTTTFNCPDGQVINAVAKGDAYLTLFDEYDQSRVINLHVTNAEGVANQEDVLLSLTCVARAGGSVHLKKGKSTLTVGGKTIRISDDCHLRATAVAARDLVDPSWTKVGPRGKPVAADNAWLKMVAPSTAGRRASLAAAAKNGK
jgi:hypothetical protein